MTGESATASEPHHAGDTFGRYAITEHLGGGAMGSVWKGVHVVLKKPVVLKLLREEFGSSPEFRARFVREGEAAARIRHPNVVEIFDVGEERGVAWLAMELLEGEDLANKLEREGALPVSEAVDLLLPVLAAVSAAHEEGVVHRDLKPENIFLSRTRDGAIVPKVLDFGIARVVDDTTGRVRTQTNMLLGTPQYMAPEQARGDRNLDDKTDQYALGAILYECVTGTFAIAEGPIYDMLDRVVNGTFPPPRTHRPELPEALDAVVLRAMSHAPARRFRSLRSFGASLIPFASEMGFATWSRVFDPEALLHGAATIVQPTASLPPGAPSQIVPRSTPSRAEADTLVDARSEHEGTTTPMRKRARWPLIAAALGALALIGLIVALALGMNR